MYVSVHVNVTHIQKVLLNQQREEGPCLHSGKTEVWLSLLAHQEGDISEEEARS